MHTPTDEKDRGGGSAFWIYNGALGAVSPVLLGWYGYRVLGSGKSRDGWTERLGFPGTSHFRLPRGKSVWVHAVSVGEVAAAAPVINLYNKRSDACPLGISTITSTGRQMANRLLPDVPGFYLPVDVLPSVKAVMKRIQPLVVAICEKEIWPNLLSEAVRSGARTVLFNGQVSDSTLQKAQKLSLIFRWALGNIDRFLMQTEEDAERIISLGADERRVLVSGNTKFDEAEEPLGPDEIATIGDKLGFTPQTPVFVAGSINEGEEEAVLHAFLAAKAVRPEMRMVLAPRQIERSAAIAEFVRAKNLTACLRSEVGALHDADVVILDTFGELASVYALAKVSFVGGTVIKKGGHNILQPLAQGSPVVFGPHDFKIRDLSKSSRLAGVGFREETTQTIAARVAELASLPDNSLHQKAIAWIQQNRGASSVTSEVFASLAQEAHRNRFGV